jgi:hypothetical protein
VQYRWDLFRVYHDALGHCGVNQLLKCIQNFFLWRGIKEDAETFLHACDACQHKRSALPELPDLQQPLMPVGPFKHVHIDLAGPFETPLIDTHGKIAQIKKGLRSQSKHMWC